MDRTIYTELDKIRHVARELTERGATNQVCGDTDAIVRGPLPKLFSGLHRSDSTFLREPLYELMRLCIRINRHCRHLSQQIPDEPFDANWFAGRLETLRSQLVDRIRAETAA